MICHRLPDGDADLLPLLSSRPVIDPVWETFGLRLRAPALWPSAAVMELRCRMSASCGAFLPSYANVMTPVYIIASHSAFEHVLSEDLLPFCCAANVSLVSGPWIYNSLLYGDADLLLLLMLLR